ncbi:hypothetical protein FE257_001454 [Aspergillus nanangensis]|uniref:Uncharacterized protein n=1 Tax=Aspergillus nanangensis TaxID=2582783 RepID=A0AAD4CDQ2_ASPNN|nr:hypothetical protein FE257_001454 [Aspergillus nanangensis]
MSHALREETQDIGGARDANQLDPGLCPPAPLLYLLYNLSPVGLGMWELRQNIFNYLAHRVGIFFLLASLAVSDARCVLVYIMPDPCRKGPRGVAGKDTGRCTPPCDLILNTIRINRSAASHPRGALTIGVRVTSFYATTRLSGWPKRPRKDDQRWRTFSCRDRFSDSFGDVDKSRCEHRSTTITSARRRPKPVGGSTPRTPRPLSFARCSKA